jgi:hypothetical protein
MSYLLRKDGWPIQAVAVTPDEERALVAVSGPVRLCNLETVRSLTQASIFISVARTST